MLTITSLQISLKSPIGKIIPISAQYSQKDLKAYRALIVETLAGLGFTVDSVNFSYHNAEPGYVIQAPEVKKQEPKVVEPEPEIDINALPQYQNKPKMR